jgi:outer membrane lipoprotein LolB
MTITKSPSLLLLSVLTACTPYSIMHHDSVQLPPTTTIIPKDSSIEPASSSSLMHSASILHNDDSRNKESTRLSWDLLGAIAARDKNNSWSASINWLQKDANNYQIRLSGPLGGGSVLIDKKGDVINFRNGSKSVSSTNATVLLQQQTGVSLPVSSLYYWIRGLIAPGAVQLVKRDKNHHLLALKQNGYTINYSTYSTVTGISLPNQVILQGHGIFVKLVIKQWKI